MSVVFGHIWITSCALQSSTTTKSFVEAQKPLIHVVLDLLATVSGSTIKDEWNARICFGNAATVPPIVALKVVDHHFLGSFAMEGSYRCMLYCYGILLF
jgi:hypothetical protein